MPEGHTIHRLARDHRGWFGGRAVSTESPQGRFSEGAEVLTGRVFVDAFAHGKHLFYRFAGSSDADHYVHIHLGLFGRFRNRKSSSDEPTPNVRLRISGADRVVDLSGPTRCELLDEEGVKAIRDRLGPDPLIDDYTHEDCLASFARRRGAIGSVLLDQKAIAGLGNIFRSELLFVLKLNPRTPANALSPRTVEELWSISREWLRLGVKTNRIITTLPRGTTKVATRKAKERTHIYKAKSCPACAGEVSVFQLGQRTAYACARCQNRSD